MPLLLSRFRGFTDWPAVGPEKLRQLFLHGIEAEFRQLYFEMAQVYDDVSFDAIRKLVPSSHILFGTDYNRFSIAHSVALFEKPHISATRLRRSIERYNALALFPRFRTAV